jgi:hypothetical protein
MDVESFGTIFSLTDIPLLSFPKAELAYLTGSWLVVLILFDNLTSIFFFIVILVLDSARDFPALSLAPERHF